MVRSVLLALLALLAASLPCLLCSLGRSLLQPRREAHIQIKGGQAMGVLLLTCMQGLRGSVGMSGSGCGKAMEHRCGDRSKAHGHRCALRLLRSFMHYTGPKFWTMLELHSCLVPWRCTVLGTLNRSTMCRGDLLRKVWWADTIHGHHPGRSTCARSARSYIRFAVAA